MWAFADQGSYKMTLRKTHKKWETAKETATQLQQIIEDKFNEQKLFAGFCDAILNQTSGESEDEIIL